MAAGRNNWREFRCRGVELRMPDQAVVDSVVAKCSTLTPDEARTFLEKGWVLIKKAFPRELAKQFVAESWRELIDDYGILPDDPSTWEQHPYVRTGDQPAVHIMASRGDKAAQEQLKASRPPKLCDVAPRALGAISDAVAGNIEDVAAMELPRSLAVNLSTKNPDGSRELQLPRLDWPGWCAAAIVCQPIRRSAHLLSSSSCRALTTAVVPGIKMDGSIDTSWIPQSKAYCCATSMMTSYRSQVVRRSRWTQLKSWRGSLQNIRKACTQILLRVRYSTRSCSKLREQGALKS